MYFMLTVLRALSCTPILICMAIFFGPERTIAQTKSFSIHGMVMSEGDSLLIHNTIVLNKRTKQGLLSGVNGDFVINIQFQDTLIFSCTGFQTNQWILTDTSQQSKSPITIVLKKQIQQLKEVTVYGTKTYDEIRKEFSNLKVKQTDTYRDVSAMSPITLLYEKLNRQERSKRQVAEMENEDRKRAALKDLFRLYVSKDILDLSDNQFDEFIGFLHLSTSYINNTTEYDLAVYIKERYRLFKINLDLRKKRAQKQQE